jgi:lambda repressor-like predicted transcriptional regulator
LSDISEDSARRGQMTEPARRGSSLAAQSLSRWGTSPQALRAVDGWALTARISPRDVVRLAVADDTGRPQNQYPALTPIDGPAPQLPWAVPLTDDQRRFHLVAFDLDLGHGDGNVLRDTEQLTGWLKQLRIEHTVAQSGPSGGRHIWLSMSEPTPADLVGALADHAATLLPTLDVSPLKNPAWGSVRPPGAPHRSGGHSMILTGTDEPLRPAVTIKQLTRLVVVIAAAATAQRPQPAPLPATTLPVDAEGHRYLPGQRRPLPAGSAKALAAVPADASASAFTVLLGAVRARWHLADVVAVLHEPGLEHIRTERDSAGRRQRDPRTRQRMLARQWNKAVLVVQRTVDVVPAAVDDPTFSGRAAAVAERIAAVQARADAAPGRWHTRTGPSARRVLDALCLLTATAVTATVEADTRRLAMLTGLGRETVRLRLHQLAADGWIALTEMAAGRRAHVWTLSPVSISPGQSSYPQVSPLMRSQGVPPPGSMSSHRLWQDKLGRRLADQNHDIFTPAGLGHAAGQLYTHLSAATTSNEDLLTATHNPPEQLQALLADLLAARLIARTAGGWSRVRRDARSAAARRLRCDGVLVRRRRIYEQERVLWAWWCDEVEWMRLSRTDPAKRRRTARVAAGQLTIDGVAIRGRYPRRGDGRADHRAAAAVRAA